MLSSYFRLGVGVRSLERHLAVAGCEVHCFEPGLREPHVQQADMWLHRLSVDWRDPNPASAAQHQHAVSKKLATILNDFGHRQVRLTPRAKHLLLNFVIISCFIGFTLTLSFCLGANIMKTAHGRVNEWGFQSPKPVAPLLVES